MDEDPAAEARRLAAEVVHEMNNALTAIVGLAEKLGSDRRLDDELREQIGIIAAQGRRLRRASARLAAFSRAQADPGSQFEDVALPATAAPVSLPTARASLLLVDDEDMVRSIVAWQLQGMGHDVVAVDSAESALAAFDAEPNRFDMALIDVILPGLSGTDLLRTLRSRRRELPVILLSGTPLAERETGVPCLTKPVPLGELQRTVAAALLPRTAPGPRT